MLGYTAEEFAQILGHIAEGDLDVAPLITGHVGLDGMADAFETLATPAHHCKIVVEPDAHPAIQPADLSISCLGFSPGSDRCALW